MRSLADTVARLAARRKQIDGVLNGSEKDRFSELQAFGSNPGNLRGWTYRPKDLAAKASLVVVLHGCTQSAASYDRGAGWSRTADRNGFAVLFPEQQRSNNPNLCFNWFVPDDTRRGSGEALSIRQMIEAVVTAHDIDRTRIFITGLSAGGAMAAAMLATYPEVFAGGAIIAGLPYGSATSLPQAFDRMRGHGGPTAKQLATTVQQDSGHDGPWPKLSVWHGSADTTVSPVNSEQLVGQWLALRGQSRVQPETQVHQSYRRDVWKNAANEEVIESYLIAGMAHGTAVDSADGLSHGGSFMIDTGISSTSLISRFWGFEEAGSQVPSPDVRLPAKSVGHSPLVVAHPPFEPRSGLAAGPGPLIESALRAAGLMK
ncbi:PHB depolymerase family esterase [Mesorhizobium sp. CO1-1-7]|uniref:extracellular catalytic domain type 1 short-chain-length polyhydroxyalkanoate depolymerase n=1 Tax=unclassified Mesorhizobium TaxID=325217 RepID=UPI00112B7643|nr:MULTISPECIES: PHB depolymerase family esterase [unclassified Mesorhizobium]MBZ9747769.1 PHB depolymerase family esterase [Mesorhizobium sp. CO1-1-7]TPL99587.1 PHB depolymerase family esterase [Mesorhizobium sp. B2-3-10]